MSIARPPIWVALRTNFVAQPRKAAVLLVLFVVLIVVYARWILSTGGPAAAEASILPPVMPVPASPAPETPPLIDRFKPDRPLIRELARDPFLVQLERFAIDPQAQVAAATTSTTSPATQPAVVEADLVLQGTVCGDNRLAWINGRCIRQGEEVEGYVLEQVEPTQVTLTRDGLKRVLSMD